MNNNKNKYFLKERINFHITIMIFLTILLIILSPYSYLLIGFIIYYIPYCFLKNKWYLVCLLPVISNFFYHQKIPKYITCSYIIENKYKNNLYAIKILDSATYSYKEQIKLPINKKHFLLKTKKIKEYFTIYTSTLYIVKNNFSIEMLSLRIEQQEPSLRQIIFNKIHKSDAIHSDIIFAVILGIKSIKDPELFKSTGTWHLLCVGGLHINIVKNILCCIFKFLSEIFCNIRILWKLFTYIQIIIVTLYAYISNFHIPALRSCLMNIMSTLFHIKTNDVPNSVSYFITFLLLLTYNMDYLWDIGFQMSFLCVYFLVMYGSLLYFLSKKSCLGKWKITRYIINMTMINTVISLLLVPFSFCLQGYFNIFSILCNIITIPIFSIGLFFSFLGLLYDKFWIISGEIFNFIIYILKYGDKYGLKIYWKIKKSHMNYYLIGIIILLLLLALLRKKYMQYLKNKQQKEINLALHDSNYLDHIF